MFIYDPVSNFFSGLIARRQRYRCIVDGCGTFRGETLPVGTEEEILAWIKARYKVLGELWGDNKGDVDLGPRRHIVYELTDPPFWYNTETWHPPHVTRRYLVEVAEAEKVFVMRPFPDGLLEWPVTGTLEWNGVAK